MKVYVDIIFFINLICDYFLIDLTNRILCITSPRARIILSAFFGGVMGVLFFIPDFSFLSSVIGGICQASLLGIVAFVPCGIREYLKSVGLMYILSMFFAGVMFFDMMTAGGGIIKNGIFYYSLPRMIIISFAVYSVLRLSLTRIRKLVGKKVSGVILEAGDKKVKVKAFVDTGNSLTEPLSKKPVMLIEEKVLKELFGEGCTLNNLIEWVQKDRIRYIPYKTIDKEGVLPGLVLDRVYIDERCIENAVVAVCDGKLKYPAILNAGM